MNASRPIIVVGKIALSAFADEACVVSRCADRDGSRDFSNHVAQLVGHLFDFLRRMSRLVFDDDVMGGFGLR